MLAPVGSMIVALPLASLPATAQSVDIADGTAKVVLPACGQSSPVTTVRTPGCSYVAIPTKAGDLYYAYLTSPGEVVWNGSVRDGALTFPGSGQVWPAMALLDGVATNTVKPSDITGTVDPTGDVSLRVNYETTIQALGFSCTAKGQISLSSSVTDPVGGGQGRVRNPATGDFAVAATSATAPTLTGAACGKASENLDLSKGVGWYLDGFLQTGPGTAPQAGLAKQKAAVKYPKRLAARGRTVILKRTVVTNAGLKATARLTWGIRRSAKGKNKRYARAKSTKNGRLTIKTTGRAKKLFVKLRLSAPSTAGYSAFRLTRVWKVR